MVEAFSTTATVRVVQGEGWQFILGFQGNNAATRQIHQVSDG